MYKKKKIYKKWIALLIVVCLLAAGGAYWRWTLMQADQEAEELVLQDNQQIIKVSVHSIMGNEMTAARIENDSVSDQLQTWLIPVGTEVVTKLGTTTTFARLASGDQLEMLVETVEDGEETKNTSTECILKIWITQ